MNNKQKRKQEVVVFHKFGRKGYSLFNVLGREVLVGTLSVVTLSHAAAGNVSTRPVTTTSPTTSTDKEETLDEVSVTGTLAPLSARQSAQIVSVFTREDIQRSGAATVNDLLKLATNVDVRQRGPIGTQTDISINGGTFDQITILLNGVNLSNPQTGHNAADFPVSMSDIERIEVLEGASARVFGSSAFSGAINIVTRTDDESNVRVSAEAGSYGTFVANASVSLAGNATQHQISGGYLQSDGGTEHSDLKRRKAYYQGGWQSTYLDLSWQGGFSSQDYGANTFYSSKYNDQYEETRRIMASVQGKIHNLPAGLTIVPQAYWTRTVDHYQLIRGMEGAKAGENYHTLDVYGAGATAYLQWALGKTAVGADVRKERIYSTALGELMSENDWRSISGTDREYSRKGERTNTSLFVEHDVLLNTVTVSMGLLMNRNTGLDGDFRFYPGIDVSWRPSDAVKVFASWNKALRLPTYTDLYTSNAVQRGSTDLSPERTSTFKLGAQYRAGAYDATLSGFYSRGRDMIDWVYESESATQYHALNIGKLNNMGFTLQQKLRLSELSAGQPFTEVRLSYSYIYQDHDTERTIYRSLYALEYLRHKAVLGLDHRLWRQLSASWSLTWQQRMNGFHPYFKLDGSLRWDDAKFSLYLKADNITAHRYYDIGGVRQPGLWLMAGGSVKFKL